jgi:hypothetical protein
MRQLIPFRHPFAGITRIRSVGVISACNYPELNREGTPLRKLMGAKVGF